MSNTRTWSPQQGAVFAWFAGGTGNLVVRARAGTGKTTTILEGVERAPESSILLCAFNRRIADELSSRLRNPRATAATLHSAGYRALRRNWSNARPDGGSKRARGLAVAAVGEDAPDPMVGLVARLCTLGRECAPLATSARDLLALAEQHDLLPSAEWEDDGWDDRRVCEGAFRAMELAARRPVDGVIDFADMLYLPIRLRMIRPTYDLVVVDECLPGKTPILLADGSSREIADIVKSRSPVEVLSYDETTGEQVRRRVTAWHEIPNRKPLVKVATRRGASGSNRNFVICTIDHKIWTKNRGWVEAGLIVPGDVVQVETSARKSQAYKTTAAGRAKLGTLRSVDNSSRKGLKPGTIRRRGGNGKGPTPPETALREALGIEWVGNYAIATGEGRDSGYPTCYKVDIANPVCKIAVEVDGQSHKARLRRDQDAKKESWLRERGWRVYRFSNRRAWQRPDECAAEILAYGDCPVDAVVYSVDPVEIRDQYVYDLTIEGTHNFYANGILVHNCQDMGPAQLLLATGLARGRVCVVGDDRQAIYGFRGADSGSVDRLKAELKAEELGLTTTYRCAKAIVADAARYVPDFQASPTAPDGLVRGLAIEKLDDDVRVGDAILSRLNAPLVSRCLALLRRGVPARVEGRDVAAKLRVRGV